MSITSTTKQYESTPHVDIAHTERLEPLEQKIVHDEAKEFLQGLQHYFDETYMHLDVKQIKEQQRGVQGYKWKALLITNRGRFHAEQIGFGIEHSLANTFNAIEEQINSKLAR